MNCKKCGAKLCEEDKFCRECGTGIDLNEESKNYISEEVTSARKTKKIVIISVAAVIVLIGAIFSYMQFFSDDAKFDKYMALGQKYLLEGNYEQAILAFEKAIEIDDKSVAAYNGIGDCYYALEDLEKAIINYEKVISIDEKNKDAYESLINVYEKKGSKDKLIETLEQYLDIYKDGEKSKKLDELQTVEFAVEDWIVRNETIGTEHETQRFEIQLPKVIEGVEGAESINKKIHEKYGSYNADNLKDVKTADEKLPFKSFGWYKIEYEVCEFDDIAEICIFTDWNMNGSGWCEAYVTKYYYDMKNKCELTEMQVLEKVRKEKAAIILKYKKTFIVNEINAYLMEDEPQLTISDVSDEMLNEWQDHFYDDKLKILDSYYYINNKKEVIILNVCGSI